MSVVGVLVTSAANTYYYQFCNSKKTWQDAQDYCKTKYDNLVEFHESGKVEAALVEAANSVDYHGEAWIGLKEEILDWTWVDGRPLLLDNWNQSDRGEGYCTLMLKSGAWRAAQCSLKNSVICERSESTVTVCAGVSGSTTAARTHICCVDL